MEFIDLLHAAIGNLPLDQRVVVELRLRGISATEIGETLGLNPATVRQRESRAARRGQTPGGSNGTEAFC